MESVKDKVDIVEKLNNLRMEVLSAFPKDEQEDMLFLLTSFVPQFDFIQSHEFDKNAVKKFSSKVQIFGSQYIRRTPRFKGPKLDKAVILWPWQKGHLEVLEPILHELADTGLPAILLSQRNTINLSRIPAKQKVEVAYKITLKLRRSRWEIIGRKLVKLSKSIEFNGPAS
jgi:hypothetical protein